jgi:hypothetical protein
MKLAHVGAASALLIIGSVAVAQIKLSATSCVSCDAVVLLSSGCGGGISVSPEPIEIEKDKAAKVTWRLINADWAFANAGQSGIVIKHPANGVTMTSASAKEVTWALPKLPSGRIHKYATSTTSTSSR